MAYYVVYAENTRIKYYTSVVSCATLTAVLIFLITVVPPYFIAYTSADLWREHNRYHEQPEVNFHFELLLIADLEERGKYHSSVWSSLPQANRRHKQFLQPLELLVNEVESNHGTKKASLNMTISVPMRSETTVRGIKLFIILHYKLKELVKLQAKTLAYIHHSANTPGGEVHIGGDLQFVQKSPLYLHLDGYNLQLVSAENFYTLPPLHFITNYFRNDIHTAVTNTYAYWTPGNAEDFLAHVVINYSEANFEYHTTIFERLKWAWMQYLSILIPFVFILRRVKDYVFSLQVVTTHPIYPWKTKYP